MLQCSGWLTVFRPKDRNKCPTLSTHMLSFSVLQRQPSIITSDDGAFDIVLYSTSNNSKKPATIMFIVPYNCPTAR